MNPLDWRPMRAQDLDAVQAIARVVHPTLPERDEVLAEKLRLCPAGCRVLADNSAPGAKPVGYFFSHPWYADEIPPLDTLLGQVPALTNTWYLHDLALLPEARRGGHGACVVRFANHLAQREGYTRLALVAVGASGPFWQRLGFEWTNRPCLEDTLLAYGDGARYMMRLAEA